MNPFFKNFLTKATFHGPIAMLYCDTWQFAKIADIWRDCAEIGMYLQQQVKKWLVRHDGMECWATLIGLFHPNSQKSEQDPRLFCPVKYVFFGLLLSLLRLIVVFTEQTLA